MTSNYKCNQTPNTFDQVIECRCTAGARDASFISVAGRKVERRLEQLRMSLNTNALKKIRMSSADLKVIFLLPPHLLNISYLNASFKNV
jgi:hypothetical protein